MAKFSRILKFQSGGTFTKTSAALPTETKTINLYENQFQTPSGAVATPSASAGKSTSSKNSAEEQIPTFDTKYIRQANAYTADKQQILGRVKELQQQIKQGVAMYGQHFFDMKESWAPLKELQQIAVFAKSEIENRKKFTEQAKTLMENNLKNNEMPLTNNAGQIMVLSENNKFKWVPKYLAYSKYRNRIISNAQGVDLAQTNALFSMRNYISNVANTEGINNFYKELDTHFSRLKNSPGEEEMIQKALIESNKNGESLQFTTNNAGILGEYSGKIWNMISEKARNTLTNLAYEKLPGYLIQNKDEKDLKDFQEGKMTESLEKKLDEIKTGIIWDHAKEFYNFKLHKISPNNDNNLASKTPANDIVKTLNGEYGSDDNFTILGKTIMVYNAAPSLYKRTDNDGGNYNEIMRNIKFLKYLKPNDAVVVGGSSDPKKQNSDAYSIINGDSTVTNAKIVIAFPMIDGKPFTHLDDDPDRNADKLTKLIRSLNNIEISKEKLATLNKEMDEAVKENNKEKIQEIKENQKKYNDYFLEAKKTIHDLIPEYDNLTYGPVVLTNVISTHDTEGEMDVNDDVESANKKILQSTLKPVYGDNVTSKIDEAHSYLVAIPLNQSVNAFVDAKLTNKQLQDLHKKEVIKTIQLTGQGMSLNDFNKMN